MIEWVTLTSEELAAVDKRLPVIVPLGLVEAHGPHLPLNVDIAGAEYFARRAAQESGAILAPVLPYGFADEMCEYSGTVGLTSETLTHVIIDLSEIFCFHGFTRQIFLSGHGANQMPVEMAIQRVWKQYPHLRAVYWNYWNGLSYKIHHGDEVETAIAMAVGVSVRMELAKDFEVNKPWYRIRSRFQLDPQSGGVNGRPSQASPEAGEKVREEIARILGSKVREIIDAERREEHG
jgi:creatinine amidohydrolase